MKNRVILLSRSYNDIDCRLPLLLVFAADPRYRVEIIGVPSNAGLHDPRKHELTGYLREKGISISTVYERGGRPLLKVASGFYAFLDRLFAGTGASHATEAVKRAAFRWVYRLSVRDRRWIETLLAGFRDAIVVTDEIVYQTGRSYFMDEVISQRTRHGYSVNSFLVGQDTYLNLWHDKPVTDGFRADSRTGVTHFVGSPNDRDVMAKKLPLERVEVVGNTRFDLPWVRTASRLSAARIRGNAAFPPAARKIVFMLSKIEYGVDLEHIMGLMNACATLPGAEIIVKPHTRGMSIEALGAGLDRRVRNGALLGSSDLIEWADSVCFTGSSIAFQAMQLGKTVVFLGFCQRYKTIFDEGKAVHVARSREEALGLVMAAPAAASAVETFLTEHVYNGVSSGEVCRAVKDRLERADRQELSHVP